MTQNNGSIVSPVTTSSSITSVGAAEERLMVCRKSSENINEHITSLLLTKNEFSMTKALYR